MSKGGVRVRMAPSPTGFFHVGNARTALYNWLYARQHDGIFIVRIEDTDRERSTKEFEDDILKNLEWLGFIPDELYRQSERTEIYKKYLNKLLDEGKAFYCTHTKDELEKESEAQRLQKEPLRHICANREKREEGSGIIRFKNNSKETLVIPDIIHGNVEYQADLLGDFSLAKNLDEALYNFAAVIDDYELSISHVIRGEDHLPNTPKQILIGQALGFPTPQFAHLPLLLGSDRSKLSKRHGAKHVSGYRTEGYIADAFINFLALLGWHPQAEEKSKKEKELFTREELLAVFDIARVQKGGAVAALDKLDWFNREYIKKLPANELAGYAKEFISKEIEKKLLPEAFPLILESARSRITRLNEIEPLIQEVTEIPMYDKNVLLWNGKLKEPDVARIIDELINILSLMNSEEFTKKHIEDGLNTLTQKEGRGAVLWPLRASLSGREHSIGPYELAEILGKDESLSRLKKARALV